MGSLESALWLRTTFPNIISNSFQIQTQTKIICADCKTEKTQKGTEIDLGLPVLFENNEKSPS